MVEKIQAFCRETNQPVPETVGQIARCIYESLALKYRWALERLEEIKGQRIDTLNIVGGGCQNKLLNQFVADSIDRPVITGPIEGAAIGNLLGQAMALGDIQTMDELRAAAKEYLRIVEWAAADVDPDPAQLGLQGSPTKVKKIENVVFAAKEAKRFTAADEDINSLMVELIASHTLG